MLKTQRDTLAELRQAARTLAEQAKKTGDFALSYRDSLGNLLRHADPLPGQTYTLLEVLTESRRIGQRLVRLRFSQHSLVNSASLTQSLRHVQNIGSRLNSVDAVFDQVKAESRALQIVGGAQWTLKSDGAVVYSLDEHINYIAAQADALKSHLPALTAADSQAGNEPGADVQEAKMEAAELSHLAAGAASDRAAISTIALDVTAMRAQLDANASRISEEAEAHKASVAAALSVISRLKDEIEDHKRTSESNVAAADTALALARERAEETSKALDSAQGSVVAIEERLRTLKAAEERGEKLALGLQQTKDEMSAAENNIADMLKRADQMLSVATVTGLAATFEGERKTLDGKMKWALGGFAVGILLLICATGLLATYVFASPFGIGTWPLGTPESTPQSGGQVELGGVLARSIILLGPFWLTLFSARRYNALFDLRQHYSHKYNLAVAVDGFQKQAPEYKEMLAALVFQKIMTNPVNEQKSRKMGETPAATMAEILKPLQDQINVLKDLTGRS